ncbi:hypothetical protein AVEN_257524-1 [Araneus ventricosus]|uniref:Uncharacterized protein n=1 Tax=Araneus ventricosus TaxID=182803 RepID=A0A4Y2VJQ1_ARAVE|nr:hypothetical protein AVEN_257524-1 [Araneus ventricosus]
MYEKTPCDVTACRREYIRTALGSEGALIDWNDFGVSSAVRAGKPVSWELFENAVIVVISYLLTVCVAKSESAELFLSLHCCLFTLVICARTFVSCTCATCFLAHL